MKLFLNDEFNDLKFVYFFQYGHTFYEHYFNFEYKIPISYKIRNLKNKIFKFTPQIEESASYDGKTISNLIELNIYLKSTYSFHTEYKQRGNGFRHIER